MWEPRLKPEQAMYGLSPPKLAPEGIEPETIGGANSKIPNQPLCFTFMIKKNASIHKKDTQNHYSLFRSITLLYIYDKEECTNT